MGASEFVGRPAELVLLGEALTSARADSSAIVVVEGESGIGKTALLRRAVRDATDASVVWASGDEAESVLEFGVARQLLADMSAQAPSGDEVFAVGAALLAGLSALEERGPVVVVIDDLHWADAGSARALLFCLRRLRADPVLVLLATRPHALDGLGESWARLLADGERVRHVRLSGLSAEEVRELAAVHGRELPGAAAARLQEHTGGNPLYVRALLAELPEEALLGGLTHIPAPRAYAAAVLAGLARLSPAARELVRAVAVLGVRARLPIAASMAAVPTDAGAVDEAVGAGLLDLAADGRQVSFAHPLMRAAVYADLAPSERRRLHQAAAALLPGPAGLAHRVDAASGEFDDDLAADLVSAATAAQVSGSLEVAARYLSWAWQVDGDRQRGERSLCDAVGAWMTTGDLRAARKHVEAVAACSDSPARRFTLALVAGGEGELARAAVEVRAVAEAAFSVDDALFRNCSAWLAVVCSMLGEDAEAIEWARRAQTIAASGANAMALQVQACGYARLGRFDEAFAVLERCSPRTPDPSALDAELLAIRGVLRDWVGDYAGAIEDLRTVLRWQRGGLPILGIIEAYAALAEAEFRAGDWPAAALHVELGLSLAEDLDQVWHVAYARAVAAQLCAARGDRVAAAEHATAAAAAARAFPSAEARGYAALARAHAAWACADWTGFIEALEPFDEVEPGSPGSHPNFALWRWFLAEAYLADGRVAEARRLREQAPDRPWGGVCDAHRARLDAWLCRAVGDAGGAEQIYAAAMPQPDAGRLADGLLALDYGRWLIDARRRRPAAAVLQTAREILSRLGAAGLVADTDRALLACGVVTSGQPGPQGRLSLLTAREQTVARLVGFGMSNREVAAELYLSVKAVEYHLSGIFAKLGIHSRRELPAELAGLPALIAR